MRHLYKTIRKPFLALSLLFFLLIVLSAYMILSGYTVSLDYFVLTFLKQHHPSASFRHFLFLITVSGNEDVLASLAVVCLLGCFLIRNYRLLFIICLFEILVAGFIDHLLKIVLFHPYAIFKNKIWVNFHSHSFPSGHAMVAVCFYGFLLYRFSVLFQKYSQAISFISVILFAFLIGFSRLTSPPCHYASDVIGGYLIGLPLLLMGIQAYKSSTDNLA